VASTSAATAPTVSAPTVTAPTVTGPLSGGKGVANAARQDLGALGYVEEEYDVTGDAVSYQLQGQAGADGKWSVTAAPPAPYRTRVIVRRPADAARFSGVVDVEWMNETTGQDVDVDWQYAHEELTREGDAYVGVSAQQLGVKGGTSVYGLPGAGLATTDPARYGNLVHPGDAYSFDIFSQVGAALRATQGTTLLGGLAPATILASGDSQSAIFLTTYVDAIHPLARVFDGFLLHSRAGGAADISGVLTPAALTGGVKIRSDVTQPVFMYETETDFSVLGYGAARQDDSGSVHTWEVAGTAHADQHLLTEVTGIVDGNQTAKTLGCAAPVNNGPHHETFQAALHQLVSWVRTGTAPPAAPRLQLSTSESGAVTIARDEHGDALGGVRTPPVDVPVATLSGDPVPGGPMLCNLFGSTTPFDAATITQLYPTPATYRAEYQAAADRAVAAGFLLTPDAQQMLAAAGESPPN
jgi:Alpha/beta hydrolase domain